MPERKSWGSLTTAEKILVVLMIPVMMAMLIGGMVWAGTLATQIIRGELSLEEAVVDKIILRRPLEPSSEPEPAELECQSLEGVFTIDAYWCAEAGDPEPEWDIGGGAPDPYGTLTVYHHDGTMVATEKVAKRDDKFHFPAPFFRRRGIRLKVGPESERDYIVIQLFDEDWDEDDLIGETRFDVEGIESTGSCSNGNCDVKITCVQ